MNTEERAIAILARANPMPDIDSFDMDTDAVTYLASLRERSSEVTQLGTRTPEQDKSKRSRLIAVAAIVVVILGAVIVMLTRANGEAPVVTEPPVTTVVPTSTPESTEELTPQLEEALAVATAFTQGRVDHDYETMGGNAVEGHIFGFVVGNLERMPEEFEWLEAVGWTTEMSGCEVVSTDPSNTIVDCEVTHQNSMSDALGEGPFDATYSMKVMYAGDEKLGTPITETTVTESMDLGFPVNEFVVGTWRPFVAWLQDAHPDDAPRMFGAEIGENEYFKMLSAGLQIPLTSPESIELWHQYVAEFVAEFAAAQG